MKTNRVEYKTRMKILTQQPYPPTGLRCCVKSMAFKPLTLHQRKSSSTTHAYCPKPSIPRSIPNNRGGYPLVPIPQQASSLYDWSCTYNASPCNLPKSTRTELPDLLIQSSFSSIYNYDGLYFAFSVITTGRTRLPAARPLYNNLFSVCKDTTIFPFSND